MGQQQSHPIDLTNKETCTLAGKVIIVAFQPIYLLTANCDQERNLATGSKDLDTVVVSRIQNYLSTLSRLIFQALNFQSLAIMQEEISQTIYVTLEKCDQTIITDTDCDQIRQFFKEYNQLTHTPILMTEEEALKSPFFDDHGDIRLGLLIEQSIDYF
jgi:hypothetical protein